MSPVHSSQEIDLRSLVGHRLAIGAEARLEEAHRLFSGNEGLQFFPVLEAGRVIGLCARRTIGVVLGARYGFSLFSRKPVRNYLLPEALMIGEKDPLPEILARVFSRGDETFDDDVLLLDAGGALIGTIFVRTLVRLQHELLRANIGQLEERKFEIEQRNAQMERDLAMAGEVQRAMLPQHYPDFPADTAPERSLLRFAHRYVPSSVVSGDFFHVVRLSDGSAGVFICDVMGHGVRSALIVAMLRALVEELRPHALDPALLLGRLNQEMRIILRHHDDPMFASAIYLTVDLPRGVLRCAVAGHPLPFHVHHESGEVAPLAVPRRDCGPVLGLFDQTIYPVGEISFPPGDRLLLFTDGVYEASAEGEEFGLDRLRATLQENGALSAERLLDRTMDEVRTFVGGQALDDDVCLLVVEAPPAVAGLTGREEAPAGAEEEAVRAVS